MTKTTHEDKRLLRYTSRFKKDLKRESKGQHQKTLKADLKTVIDDLANDVILAEKYKDHALTGNWVGYRDCHIKPDLVLIFGISQIRQSQRIGYIKKPPKKCVAF